MNRARFSIHCGDHTLELGQRSLLMGAINVTPDSFSDGGKFFAPEQAVDHFQRLVDEGAEIIDLGAESSRPGAEPVDVGEEWRRLGPVLSRVAGKSPVPISVDTYKAEIARRAGDSGAAIINDISALRFDLDRHVSRSLARNPSGSLYRQRIRESSEFL